MKPVEMPEACGRILTLDVLRGMAIFLVVLGHIVYLPKPLFAYIYSFHMPLFFLLSGYLLSRKKLELCFKKYCGLKWKRLIVPYFGMGVICNFFLIFFFGVIQYLNGVSIEKSLFIKPWLGLLYSFGSTEWMPFCIPLWFLTCLFCVEMLFYTVYKKCNRGGGGVILAIALIGYIFHLFVPFKLIWNLDTAFTALSFYGIGYWLRKKEMVHVIEALPVILKTAWFLFGVLCSYFSLRFNYISVDLNGGQYGNVFLFYLGSLGGIITWYMIAEFMKQSRALCFLGRYTMPIVGFHLAVYCLVGWLMNNGLIDILCRYSGETWNYWSEAWLLRFILTGILLSVIILKIYLARETYFVRKFILGNID